MQIIVAKKSNNKVDRHYHIRYWRNNAKSMSGHDTVYETYENEEEVKRVIAERIAELRKTCTKIQVKVSTDDPAIDKKVYEWKGELTQKEVEAITEAKEEIARLLNEKKAIEERIRELRRVVGKQWECKLPSPRNFVRNF